MALVDQKAEIFGNIAALNVLNDGFPDLTKFNSFSSIDNGTNTTDFLIDLIISLVGYKALNNFLVETITYRMDQLEDAIKDGLKQELKEIVSCQTNPSIPSWFQQGGVGVTLKVEDIDFFDIMKVNPESDEGGLIYTDVINQEDSKDFNTYLHYTIQTPSVTNSWGNSVISEEVLDTTFLETTTNGNNILKFTAGADYTNKQLAEFNNAYLDTLSLFGNPDSINASNLLAMLLEDLFGAIGNSVKKSKKQITKELEIKEVLEKIINLENDVIDDSIFTFDNPTLSSIDEEATNLKNGIRKIKTCGDVASRININDIIASQDLINSSSSKSEEANAVTESLNNVATIQAAFVNSEQDVETAKTNFFVELIKKFVRVIMTLIISPKFMAIFAINHQIIYGQGTEYLSALDFIEKNKKLMKNISKIIVGVVVSLLLKEALKVLSEKLRAKFAGDQIEAGKNYVSILLSYVGVSPSIISQIRQL